MRTMRYLLGWTLHANTKLSARKRKLWPLWRIFNWMYIYSTSPILLLNWFKKIMKCISSTNRCFYGLILEPYMKTSSKRQWCENYFGRPEQKQRMNWRISSKLITRHLREGWVEYFMAPHQMQTFDNVSITATRNFKLLNKFCSLWLKACRK